jgi:hypothetical protein
MPTIATASGAIAAFCSEVMQPMRAEVEVVIVVARLSWTQKGGSDLARDYRRHPERWGVRRLANGFTGHLCAIGENRSSDRTGRADIPHAINSATKAVIGTKRAIDCASEDAMLFGSRIESD